VGGCFGVGWLYVGCWMVDGRWWVVDGGWWMVDVVCCMLYVVCWVLYVVCCMLVVVNRQWKMEYRNQTMQGMMQ
jgi:hypothetical protein